MQTAAGKEKDAIATAERRKRRWRQRSGATETQAREADARAERSEAEGEANALRAEVTALAKLSRARHGRGRSDLDRLQVEQGFEKALGAALADDLRAPEVESDGPSGWRILPSYEDRQPLPEGVTSLARHVSVPDVLERRASQIGLVDADDGQRLQAQLKPGQRLVSLEGDLWRWDGYRAWAEDAPSAAALRLEQLNRLEVLKQEMERATSRVEAAQRAHETLTNRLAELTAQTVMRVRRARMRIVWSMMLRAL